MEQMYITRLEHVCSRLTKMGLTQMIVSDPLSIRYLTGVWVDPYERLYALYLRTDGKHRFFLNNLFVVPDIDIPKTWFSDTDDGVAVIAGLVDGNVDMGIDKNWPARFLLALMEHHPNVRYVNASSCIDGERAIKDEYERQKMREASLLNDACIEKAAAHIKAGMTELECADYIRSLYKEAGCIESFSTIVSFGANAADPHHEPDDTVLKPGIHIQKRKLIQLQIRRAQRLGRTGADDGLQLDRPSFEIIVDIVCHTRTERRVVVTNQNVHPKFLSAAKGSPYCKRSPRTPSVSHPLDSLLNEGAH